MARIEEQIGRHGGASLYVLRYQINGKAGSDRVSSCLYRYRTIDQSSSDTRPTLDIEVSYLPVCTRPWGKRPWVLEHNLAITSNSIALFNIMIPFTPKKTWQKSAMIYQIYPSSFLDSSPSHSQYSGTGKLLGILKKLDYLKDLGVDILWLSPCYKSGGGDGGYDISNYQVIDPKYGTIEDWDKLLAGVHERKMKLMMDLVVNHTSDEHEWFTESRSSTTNPKRDWYIWRPPKYDSQGNRQPPNNWRSIFQGSAWQYEPETNEYYLHLYLSQQPDLNWENPEVRRAVWGVMNFWIKRGCDGFRMDVINLISKVPGLPDAPITEPEEEYQNAFMYYANGPRVHEFLKMMNAEVLSQHDLITVGETPFTHTAEELAPYVLPSSKELDMVFQFELMDIDAPHNDDESEANIEVSRVDEEGKGEVTLPPKHVPLVWKQWTLGDMKDVVNKWQTTLRDEGFWNAVFIENHDQARSVSRFGNDSPKWRAISAKLLAILQITQTGTLYIYQGEELGMKNFPRSWGIEEYKDVASLNYWNKVQTSRERESGGNKARMSDILDDLQRKARDHARTPMQWDNSPHAGFTAGDPWMRVNDDYETWNAADQVKDKDSVWSFWKKALSVRKAYDVLIYGDFVALSPDHEQVFAYTRNLGKATALVTLNFTESEVEFSLGRLTGGAERFSRILGNYSSSGDIRSGQVVLKGYEGRVYVC